MPRVEQPPVSGHGDVPSISVAQPSRVPIDGGSIVGNASEGPTHGRLPGPNADLEKVGPGCTGGLIFKLPQGRSGKEHRKKQDRIEVFPHNYLPQKREHNSQFSSIANTVLQDLDESTSPFSMHPTNRQENGVAFQLFPTQRMLASIPILPQPLSSSSHNRLLLG